MIQQCYVFNICIVSQIINPLLNLLFVSITKFANLSVSSNGKNLYDIDFELAKNLVSDSTIIYIRKLSEKNTRVKM